MACVFNKQLLHPRNWLTWFGLGIPLVNRATALSAAAFYWHQRGSPSRRFLKRREHIARRNIELCFLDTSRRRARP